MATYKRLRYLFITTDPVHVGTGGYRLGRVDNSIVREPGTKIPKIPGTSLHGAARSYAAQLYETPEAAGQSQENVADPDQNPICFTFGYIRKDGSSDKAFSGVVNIFDAQILLFPVYSLAGPVWATTKTLLEDAGFQVKGMPSDWESGSVLLTWKRKEPLNLGWLMLNVAGNITIESPKKWEEDARWNAISNRIVLVQDALFSQVVNSNLEVRTSVAINPERGAAEDKALFTYEALPRATFLVVEVILDNYRDGSNTDVFPKTTTANGKPLPGQTWNDPLDVLNAGFSLIEWLGVGGMGTRGFGRMAIVGKPLVQKYGEEGWQ